MRADEAHEERLRRLEARIEWSPIDQYPVDAPRVTVRTATGDEYAMSWRLPTGQWVIPCGTYGHFGIETPVEFRALAPAPVRVPLPVRVWRFLGLLLVMLAGAVVACVLAVVVGVPAMWREAGEP